MMQNFWRRREHPFWRTLNAIARIRLAIARLIPGLIGDLRHDFAELLRRTNIHKDPQNFYGQVDSSQISDDSALAASLKSFAERPANVVTKPIIFVSACESKAVPGGWKYNGGIKELNYLVKLLRSKGYDAYMVTYDGTYEPWLVEHQPHISLETFCEQLRVLPNVRCVTSWAAAQAFIHHCPQLYFWDMEAATSDNRHFHLLEKLYRKKICSVASISRTVQAWHMAHFQKSCTLIPNLLDETLWYPSPSERKPFRIGYMDEGAHTVAYLSVIKNTIEKEELPLEFQLIRGNESDILTNMRSCEVFLSMNIGKDSIWGEGCPRTVIEALAVGCVVIAFDVIGNRETIQDNFNSILVPRYRPDLMANQLAKLYSTPDRLNCLYQNSIYLIQSCHTFEARWTAVQNFLNL